VVHPPAAHDAERPQGGVAARHARHEVVDATGGGGAPHHGCAFVLLLGSAVRGGAATARWCGARAGFAWAAFCAWFAGAL
jgi:hypothetical protein